MPKQIRRTKQLRQDLIEIYRYIHERDPQAADKVFEAIERNIKALLETPGVGHRWDSSHPRLEGMRVAVVAPYRNYLIFFRAFPNGVEVYRLIHGARALEQIVDDIDVDFEE
jgi:toxin ParE1/3/4